MKKFIYPILLFLLILVVPAQRGTLKTPRVVGQISGFDVVSIILEFEYDPTTNQHELAVARIAVLEGEVLDDGLATERFESHVGEGFIVDVADLSPALVASAKLLHRHALNNYGTRKGYPTVP